MTKKLGSSLSARGVDGNSLKVRVGAPTAAGRIGDSVIATVGADKRLFEMTPAGWVDRGSVKGPNGWTALERIVTDGTRRVTEVYDWVGGAGDKPATGYKTSSGALTPTIGEAEDIRGPAGPEALIEALDERSVPITYDTLTAVGEDSEDNERATVKHLFEPAGQMLFLSEGDAEDATVPAAIQRVYIAELDVRRHRVATEPSHAGKHRSTDRYLPDGNVDSTHGGWWADTGRILRAEQFASSSALKAAAMANNAVVLGLADDMTVTVGGAGDFSTINAALAFLTRIRPAYKSGGFSATISLLSGFVMAEQVLVRGIDLSWITITSVDAEVTITRSALSTWSGVQGDTCAPAFGADRGGILPTIGALFVMDVSGSSAGCVGLFVTNRSGVTVLEHCGVKNAGGKGAWINRKSSALLHEAIFTGAGNIGLHVSRQSDVDAGSIDVSGAASHGVMIERSCTVDAANALDAANCGGDAVRVINNSKLMCNSADLTNAGGSGAHVQNCSQLMATQATATGAGAAALFVEGSCQVQAQLFDGSGATGNGAEIRNSSTVTATSANFSNAGGSGVIVDAAFFNGNSLNCSGAAGTNGLAASNAAVVNFVIGNARKGVSNNAADVSITNGAIVNGQNLTGGTAIRQNMLDSRGVIFNNLAPMAPHRGLVVTIADDAVATIPLITDGSIISIVCAADTTANRPRGDIFVRTNFASRTISNISMPAAVTGVDLVTNTTLTGTIGTDGKCTIAANDGVLQIENRDGGTRIFVVQGIFN